MISTPNWSSMFRNVVLLVLCCCLCYGHYGHGSIVEKPAFVKVFVPLLDGSDVDGITLTLHQYSPPYKNKKFSDDGGVAGSSFYRFMDKVSGWAFAEHNPATGRFEGEFYDAKRDVITPFQSIAQYHQPNRKLIDSSAYTSSGDGDDEEIYYSDSGYSNESDILGLEFLEYSVLEESILCKAIEMEEDITGSDNSSRLLETSKSSNSIPPTEGDHIYYGNNTCYTGDANVHEFAISITIHSSVVDQYGSHANALSALESVIARASLVYEYQFNLRLSIDHVIFAGDQGATGDIYTSCYGNTQRIENWLSTYLNYRRSSYDAASSSSGAWLHFMNCGTSDGYAGIAYVGSAGCRQGVRGYNTGVVKTSYTTNMWRLFAHELGHLFGAHHSSDNGIMSYGTPLVDGRPLFKQERVDEMCPVMEDMVADSCQFFSKVPLELVRTLTPEETTCSFSGESECNDVSNYCTWSDGECRFQPFHLHTPGTQCKHNNKRRAKWMTSVDAPSIASCMTACAYSGSCYGVDYNEDTLSCDMWTVSITHVNILKSSPESRCIVLNSDAPTSILECGIGETSECSRNCSYSVTRNECGDKSFKLLSGGGGKCLYNGNDRSSFRTVQKNIPSLEDCFRLCDATCGAVDYQASRKKCLLWNKNKIPTAVGSTVSRSCYVKVNV